MWYMLLTKPVYFSAILLLVRRGEERRGEERRGEERRGEERRGEERRVRTASSWLVLVALIFLLRRSTWSLKCCIFFWSSSCCCSTSFKRLSCFLPSFWFSAARLVSLSRSTSNSRTCDGQQRLLLRHNTIPDKRRSR